MQEATTTALSKPYIEMYLSLPLYSLSKDSSIILLKFPIDPALMTWLRP